MKGTNRLALLAACFAFAGSLLISGGAVAAEKKAAAAPAAEKKAAPAPAAEKKAAPAAVPLTPEDCAKCHPAPPADINAAGGKHKTDVTCIDCHASHRPAVKNNIPKCTNCHEGKPHFELKNCLECHHNPHKPKDIILTAKMTDPCLTCHTDQIKQLRENKSKHSALFCTFCHEKHGQIPDCTKCHKAHSAEMTKTDCKKCHKAHMPKVVTYGTDVANKDCGACHKNAMSLLAATSTKHKSVACVKCHKEKHKMVPQCTQCHTKLHPAAILKKFPKCSLCHSIAHDLNNWPATKEGADASAAHEAKKSKKK